MNIDPKQLGPRLFGVAYRMLGDIHDAEDLVQETFLRWHREPRHDVATPEAWLVRVVTRLAIDRLRERSAERANYPGLWLPTPVGPDRCAEPADRAAELASDLSMAFLVMMERLAPEERAAFLMREVCDSSYADIARVLKRSEAAARQVVSRARARVRADRTRFRAASPGEAGLLERFVSALQTGDVDGLVAVMAPDASLSVDGGGRSGSARRLIRGGDRIVRLLSSLHRKRAVDAFYSVAILNGERAILLRTESRVLSASFIATDGARITAIYRVMNPEKLGDARRALDTRVPVPELTDCR